MYIKNGNHFLNFIKHNLSILREPSRSLSPWLQGKQISCPISQYSISKQLLNCTSQNVLSHFLLHNKLLSH